MANFFRDQRDAAGLTQQQIADALGLSPQAVSNWESGKGFPSAEFIRPLAKLLRINPIAILAAAEQRASRKSPAPKSATPAPRDIPDRAPGSTDAPPHFMEALPHA